MEIVSVSSFDFAALVAAAANIGAVLGKALLVFVVCRIAMNILTKLSEGIFAKLNINNGILGFARTAVKVALWALTIIIVAETLGIDTTSLVAVVSVVSLALSLSVQNILTNVFSGVTILISRPFEVGQFVEIAGVSGTVTAVSVMHTTLETPDKKEILIPNSEITASKIINFSSEPLRRVDLTFSASYDAPTALVKQALYEAMAADERILTEPAPFVGLSTYNPNDISYVARAWCAGSDYWGVYFDLNERVREVFAKYDILFSYPHIIVHTDK